MTSLPKFGQYAAALAQGALTADDLKAGNVTPEDALKLRLDAPVMYGASPHLAEEKFAPKVGKDRKVDYVYVTETPIGSLHDLPLANSWNLDAFKQRGNPILYGHNIDEDRLPIGKGYGVKRNQVVEGVRSLIGGVEFDAEGANPFTDMVYGAVERKMIRCFSVGFQIRDGRLPTPEEVKLHDLNEYATVYTDCSLTEGSIVPIGRDPLAGVLNYSARAEELEAFLQGFPEAKPDDLRRFRMELFGAKSDRTVVTVDVDLEDAEKKLAELTAQAEALAAKTPEERIQEAYAELGGDPADSEKALEDVRARAKENAKRPATYGELKERDIELASLRADNRRLAALVTDQEARLQNIEEAFGVLDNAGGDSPETDLTPEDIATLEQELAGAK